ncbi:hypothetical protein BAE44_0008955, partial [Dichanthelium oligosanthes]
LMLAQIQSSHIFYLSIFSAEKDIRPRRLLWRWIAEGYCRDTSGGISEENGEKFISELINLSIIQKQSSSKVLCRINGFFHEYIISRPMEDNLVFALEGDCSLNSQRSGQHLTIRSNWDRDTTVFESIDFSRLRSLTVFGKWKSFFISSNVNMRLLRVLDLEDALEIGKLSALHTFGVVNVNGSCGNGSCGKSIFEELKKLNQLRKLGVSGINKGNIKDFCCAISGHAHLKSLSVEIDKGGNLDGLDGIPQPPKTLNSLKLYGRVHKLLVWTKQLDNLEKL